MNRERDSKIPEMLHKYEREILADWLEQQQIAFTRRSDLIKDIDLQAQSREFLSLFSEAAQTGSFTDTTTSHWQKIYDFLGALSLAHRARVYTFGNRYFCLFAEAAAVCPLT